MPSYVLICTECEKPLKDEVICTIADRAEMRCPCGGEYQNDYARMETSNFSLKGDNWPGKMVALENKVMKEGS